MIGRLILCLLVVAGGVWFLAWTIWNLRLPSWLTSRPDRYVPRHRSDGYEPVADDNGEDIADLFPQDVPRPGAFATRATASGRRPAAGPGHPCTNCGHPADGAVFAR